MKKFALITLSVLVMFMIYAPAPVHAAWTWGQPLIKCSGVGSGEYGKCGFDQFVTLLNTLLQFMLIVSPFLAAIAFAIAGFLYVTAAGDSGKIETAHSIFGYTLLGLVIVLAAWIIVKFIISGLLTKPEFDLLK